MARYTYPIKSLGYGLDSGSMVAVGSSAESAAELIDDYAESKRARKTQDYRRSKPKGQIREDLTEDGFCEVELLAVSNGHRKRELDETLRIVQMPLNELNGSV